MPKYFLCVIVTTWSSISIQTIDSLLQFCLRMTNAADYAALEILQFCATPGIILCMCPANKR